MLLFVGCSAYEDSSEKKVDKVVEKIVYSFDNKDAQTLKSLLNEDVIIATPQLDADIQKAFEFYKGKSIKFERSDDSVNTTVENDNIQKICHTRILVTTECGVYSIPVEYLVEDKKNPQKQGVYGIKIMQFDFFKSYFSTAGSDVSKLNQLQDELPDEVKVGKPDAGYKQYGMGIFTYTIDDIKEAYYKKNGKPMVLKD